MDSVPIIIQMFLDTIEAFSVPGPDYAAIELQVRLGLLIDEMFRAVPVQERDIPAYISDYRRRYREVGIPATKAYPDAALCLEALTAGGLKIAVATSKIEELARSSIRASGLDPWISLILGSDNVASPKPAPDSALKACNVLGIDPLDAIVVGDSTKDILMGKAAGMRTCAALFHDTGRDEVTATRPDVTIGSLSELPALIL